MNFLSALPDLKRREHDKNCYGFNVNNPYLHCTCGATRYNQVLDDLAKYELCEDELAKLIKNTKGQDGKYLPTSMNVAKEIISNTHLWIKRKDVK